MHKTLLLLVETHARVSDVALPLVPRILGGLITSVTQVALSCFQQIPKFGTGGMLLVGAHPTIDRFCGPLS
jgi:exocyst complex component 2